MIIQRRNPILDALDDLLGLTEIEIGYTKHKCRGGKGGGSGGGTTTVNSSNAPPPQVMAAYQTALNSAQTAASQPLQQYNAPIVAGFTPDQLNAFSTIAGSQGIANPYISAAQQQIQAGTTPLWNNVQQFSPSTISQYQSPYTTSVLNAAMAQQQNQDAQQQEALKGNAISSGAWGGDRAGVASAILSGQQDIANNATNANILNQGYNTALGEFNTQQQAQLGANEANNYLAQQAAFGLANLGTEAQNTALTGANAQEAAGAIQQQLGQAQLNIPYQQFLQAQAYPFQTAQYFANVAEGIGSNSGGVGSSATTTPAPSIGSQIAGFGLGGLGILGATGAFANRGGRVGGFARGGRARPRGFAMGGVPDMSVDFIPNTQGATGHGPPQASSSSAARQSPGGGSGMSATDLAAVGKGAKGLYNWASSLFPSEGAGLSNALDPAAADLASISNPLDMFNLAGGASDFAGFGADAAIGGADMAATDAAATAATDAGFWSSIGDAIMSAFAFNKGGSVHGMGARHNHKGMGRYDVGGATPMQAQMQGQTQPSQQSQLNNMTPEQLQVLATRLPIGSPQQRAVQTLLNQKRMMPNVGAQAQQPQAIQQQPQATQQQPQTGMQGSFARGGRAYGGGGGVVHSNTWMDAPGGFLGSAIGSIWGPLGTLAGHFAGENAGATLGDLTAGNINGLGADVSANLPPGFQDKGIGGLINGATGLPLGNIFGFKRGGRARGFAGGGNAGIEIDAPPPPETIDNTMMRAQDLGDLPGFGGGGLNIPQVPIDSLMSIDQNPHIGKGPPQPISPLAEQTAAPSEPQAEDKLEQVADAGSSTKASGKDESSYASDEPPNSRAPAKPNPWLALANAGFAMAAGTSPYAGVNIGRGAEAGFQNYTQQQKEADTVNEAADKLMLEAKQHKDTIAQEQARTDEEVRHNKAQENLSKVNVSRNPITGALDVVTVNPTTGKISTQAVGSGIDMGNSTSSTGVPVDIKNAYTPPVGEDGKPLSGEKYLETLPPVVASWTKRFGDLQDQVTPYMITRGDPAIKAAVNAAAIYHPGWTSAAYPNLQKYMFNANGGVKEKALDTVVPHTQLLRDLAAAMDTGNVELINRAQNAFQTEMGLSSKPTNLQSAAQLIGSEIVNSTLATGKGSALGDREEIAKQIDAAMSPKLLVSNLDNVYLPALRAQANATGNFYKNATGLNNFQGRLKPETQKALWGTLYPGTEVNGFKFMGGDIKDKNNWKPISGSP